MIKTRKNVKANLAEPIREGIRSLVEMIIEDQNMRDLQEWGIDNAVDMDNEGNINLDSLDVPQLQEIYHDLEIMAFGESTESNEEQGVDTESGEGVEASAKRGVITCNASINVNNIREALKKLAPNATPTEIEKALYEITKKRQPITMTDGRRGATGQEDADGFIYRADISFRKEDDETIKVFADEDWLHDADMSEDPKEIAEDIAWWNLDLNKHPQYGGTEEKFNKALKKYVPIYMRDIEQLVTSNPSIDIKANKIGEGMQAIMMRKASNVDDWKQYAKRWGAETSPVVIEKTIEISEEEFRDLCEDFFEDRKYITENIDHMYMQDGVWHCLLVKSPSSTIGILIESEGYDYARYTSVIDLKDVRAGLERKSNVKAGYSGSFRNQWTSINAFTTQLKKRNRGMYKATVVSEPVISGVDLPEKKGLYFEGFTIRFELLLEENKYSHNRVDKEDYGITYRRGETTGIGTLAVDIKGFDTQKEAYEVAQKYFKKGTVVYKDGSVNASSVKANANSKQRMKDEIDEILVDAALRDESSCLDGRRLEYEDDIVVVKRCGEVLYKGMDDYNPMKYEDWDWSAAKGLYELKSDRRVTMKVLGSIWDEPNASKSIKANPQKKKYKVTFKRTGDGYGYNTKNDSRTIFATSEEDAIKKVKERVEDEFAYSTNFVATEITDNSVKANFQGQEKAQKALRWIVETNGGVTEKQIEALSELIEGGYAEAIDEHSLVIHN